MGRLMAQGEHASMTALYSIAPDMVPKPLGWGTLEINPNSHFFISEYIELSEEVPEPSSFCPKLAQMHRKSVEMSSNGMFGFEVTTCNGTFPQDNTWDESWERFFSRQTEGAFKAEQEVHGTCEEYERLLPPLFSKVIPRLLRPLETGGNRIRPVLVHGMVLYCIGPHKTDSCVKVIYGTVMYPSTMKMKGSFLLHWDCHFIKAGCSHSQTLHLRRKRILGSQ